jgi:alpha-N-arabinofuranosidase
MLQQCSENMEYLSEHFYKGEGKDLLSHVRQIPDAVRHIADSHRKYRQDIKGLAEKDIRIAVDEWNYWYGPELYGEIGTRYFLKDALGIAMGIHEFARNSDIIYMANYAQTVNVIGCIKTSKTAASFDTTGLVLKLYRNHLGSIPVGLSGDIGDLDVLAAWTQDRKHLTLAVVNPATREVQLDCEFEGFDCPVNPTKWEITGPDAMSFNNPGEEANVTLVEREVSVEEGSLALSPLSVSLFKF